LPQAGKPEQKFCPTRTPSNGRGKPYSRQPMVCVRRSLPTGRTGSTYTGYFTPVGSLPEAGDNAPQAGFGDTGQCFFRRAPACLSSSFLRPVSTLLAYFEGKDVNPTVLRIACLPTLVIVECADGLRLHFSGYARFFLSLMCGAVGRSKPRNGPAFRHNPAPRVQRGDQKDLQLAIDPAPRQGGVLNARTTQRNATHYKITSQLDGSGK
jgi:hypothetical protein